jgi:hypothetical protein
LSFDPIRAVPGLNFEDTTNGKKLELTERRLLVSFAAEWSWWIAAVVSPATHLSLSPY